MNVLSLFSGIGAFDLGLERAGMTTVAFCECDPFARRVLAKHWPEVPCYDDVRTLTAERLRADGISVDVIAAGFPCQDISVAGAGAGITGSRSGLWSEVARLIGELRPRYVFVENVAALLGRGMGVVLGDLAALGYDAEWHVISAADMGAPHLRERVWIVAYPESGGTHVADPIGAGLEGCAGVAGNIANEQPAAERGGTVPDTRRLTPARDWWLVEPDVGRMAARVASRVDRLRCLGNALVPQIPELIGRAIIATLGIKPP